MGQPTNAPPPHGSFGDLLRACRHRALLSQEQLAARAELSERTVRNLEAGRVRSPRVATVRLLADALQLSGPERESWFKISRGMNHRRPESPGPGAGERPPGDVPGRLPLAARGLGPGSSPRRRCSAAGAGAGIAVLPAPRDRPVSQPANGPDRAETAARARAGRAEPDPSTGHDDGLTSAERRELAQLRRENRRLREGVEIMKQATAILATITPSTSTPFNFYPALQAQRA